MSLSSNFPTIKPSLNLDFANVGRLDPRVTFTRASTATYYDGVTTAMAEQNLLTYSQEFDNAIWGKDNGSVSSNTTAAPDGTTTADTFTENSANDIHRLNFGGTGAPAGIVTCSVFVKAGAGTRYPTVGIASGNAAYASATFDLSTGTNTQTLSAGYSGVSASIQNTGGGWYRCVLTATTTATANFYVALSDSSTFVNGYRGAQTYTGDSTSTLIFWGAQLEQRSSVTAYTATTTAPITNYIPVLLTAQNDVPRFDHNPTTGVALGLLIEEQRTNLLTYSEQFDNAAWVYSRTTVSANTAVAPNGQITAASITNDTTSGVHSFASRNNYAISANTTHTYSVYLKFNGGRYVVIRLNNGADTDGASVCVDLVAGTHTAVTQNGTATGSTASITSVGNGWYRVSLTVLVDAVSTSADIRHFINQNYSTTIDSYAGSLTESLFIWGAQLEAGAFATSYIPTTTTALTRNADAASMTGTNFSSWYNASEGTFYAEAQTVFTSGTKGIFRAVKISDSTERIRTSFSGATVNYLVNTAAGTQANLGLASAAANTFTKAASAYKVNDFAGSCDGAAVVTDTSGSIPTGIDFLHLGQDGSASTTLLNGTIRKIAYYPSRLSDAQLQALTG